MNQTEKGKDGTDWLSLHGGLYFGRTLIGTIRVCVTNGLPPWDPRAGAAFVELQPNHFANAAAWVLRVASRSSTFSIGDAKVDPCPGESWYAGTVAGTEMSVAFCTGCHLPERDHRPSLPTVGLGEGGVSASYRMSADDILVKIGDVEVSATAIANWIGGSGGHRITAWVGSTLAERGALA